MNLTAIHDFISKSYWAKGISKSVLDKAVTNSLCFGVFIEDSKQIGFARVITDYATFAYLADVYILQEYRGLGLSKRLINEVVCHPDLHGLRRMLLATSDAHGLYQKFGFTSLSKPEIMMERWDPEVYSKLDL